MLLYSNSDALHDSNGTDVKFALSNTFDRWARSIDVEPQPVTINRTSESTSAMFVRRHAGRISTPNGIADVNRINAMSLYR